MNLKLGKFLLLLVPDRLNVLLKLMLELELRLAMLVVYLVEFLLLLEEFEF